LPSAGVREAVRSQVPEPGRFWVRYVPRSWEVPDRPWAHLATARLGEWERKGAKSASPVALESLAETPLADVLYLPPMPAKRARARDDLASARLVEGTPVLIQLFPGDEPQIPPVQGVTLVFDLLEVLLRQDLKKIEALPTGASVVWPLLPGLTDEPALWEEGCRGLAAAGARCAQALTLTLTPADRRGLLEEIEDPDAAFEALFHRQPPSERAFAQVAHLHGLDPFLPRPLPRAPVHARENRRIGEVLALAAELCLRLGRSAEQGQSLYRAARWVDESTYGLEALAREGNLAVIQSLDERSRIIIEEVVETGESMVLAELLGKYVGREGEGV
jgi:hypothetical protein